MKIIKCAAPVAALALATFTLCGGALAQGTHPMGGGGNGGGHI